MKKLILASASPRRKETLEQIDIDFDIIPSSCEEVITKQIPREIVEELARQKAEEVFEKTGESSIVIGADTIVVFNNKIMGKPKNEEDAFNMINDLQDNTHIVYTGVCVIFKENDETKKILFTEATDVSVYPMSKDQILEYIATKEPMDKAGAYAVQGKFAVYIKKINGSYNNVVGMPIARLYNEMFSLGIDLKKL